MWKIWNGYMHVLDTKNGNACGILTCRQDLEECIPKEPTQTPQVDRGSLRVQDDRRASKEESHIRTLDLAEARSCTRCYIFQDASTTNLRLHCFDSPCLAAAFQAGSSHPVTTAGKQTHTHASV